MRGAHNHGIDTAAAANRAAHEASPERTGRQVTGKAITDPPGLLPDRHPTADFFVCDVFDAVPKDDMGTMEHPLFSLSTRPDRRILSYEHNGVEITVTPSVSVAVLTLFLLQLVVATAGGKGILAVAFAMPSQ